MRGGYKYIVLFCMSLYSCNDKEKFLTREKKAVAYMNKGKYDAALDHINKAIILDSNTFSTYLIRGLIESYTGKDNLAVGDFKKAISLDKKSTASYYHCGVSYWLLNKDDSAVFFYNKAIETKMSGDFYFDEPNSNSGNILGLQLNILSEAIIFQRGLSYYELGKDSLALEDFYYSLNHNFAKGKSELYIGVLLLNQDKNLACSYLKRALADGEVKAEDYIDNYCK